MVMENFNGQNKLVILLQGSLKMIKELKEEFMISKFESLNNNSKFCKFKDLNKLMDN